MHLRIASILILALLASGCVSSRKYDAAVQELSDTRQSLTLTNSELEGAQAEISQTNQKLMELRHQLDMASEELFDLLQPIMLFSDEPGWEVLDALDEEEIADLQATIPGVAQDIQRFWLARRQFPTLSADGLIESETAVDPDGPCPCGSGKPFRKCCLH